jgi:hypothetical protein
MWDLATLEAPANFWPCAFPAHSNTELQLYKSTCWLCLRNFVPHYEERKMARTDLLRNKAPRIIYGTDMEEVPGD